MSEEQAQQPEQPRVLTEDDVIDFTIRLLYSRLDVDELHFEKQILPELGVQIAGRDLEHLREVILATGFVSSPIGFGKVGMMQLTSNGMQLMKQYKGYIPFLRHQQQQQAAQVLPLMQAAARLQTQQTNANSDPAADTQNPAAASEQEYDDMAH
jgi:predicted flavoprotein YhiN